MPVTLKSCDNAVEGGQTGGGKRTTEYGVKWREWPPLYYAVSFLIAKCLAEPVISEIYFCDKSSLLNHSFNNSDAD